MSGVESQPIGTVAMGVPFGAPYDFVIEESFEKLKDTSMQMLELWILSVIDQGVHPKDISIVQKVTGRSTVTITLKIAGEEGV